MKYFIIIYLLSLIHNYSYLWVGLKVEKDLKSVFDEKFTIQKVVYLMSIPVVNTLILFIVLLVISNNLIRMFSKLVSNYFEKL